MQGGLSNYLKDSTITDRCIVITSKDLWTKTLNHIYLTIGKLSVLVIKGYYLI